MRIIKLSIFFLILATSSMAQDFLTAGTIEYEVKMNVKRMYAESFKSKVGISFNNEGPEFYSSKRQLLFSGDKLLYYSLPSAEFEYMTTKSSVYTDLQQGKAVFKGGTFGASSVFQDSVKHVRWKIVDETRNIAGWKCRKAVGVIMDSVYVVAFFCPEIIPQGGPEFFTGLPGMILGLAIPRSYTTWFATKVQLAVDEKKIVPPAPEKKEQVITMAEMRKKWREDMKAYVKDSMPDEVLDATLKGLTIKSVFSMY